jgi:hypothetical protein
MRDSKPSLGLKLAPVTGEHSALTTCAACRPLHKQVLVVNAINDNCLVANDLGSQCIELQQQKIKSDMFLFFKSYIFEFFTRNGVLP